MTPRTPPKPRKSAPWTRCWRHAKRIEFASLLVSVHPCLGLFQKLLYQTIGAKDIGNRQYWRREVPPLCEAPSIRDWHTHYKRRTHDKRSIHYKRAPTTRERPHTREIRITGEKSITRSNILTGERLVAREKSITRDKSLQQVKVTGNTGEVQVNYGYSVAENKWLTLHVPRVLPRIKAWHALAKYSGATQVSCHVRKESQKARTKSCRL